jgi:hypothetical protein
LQFKIAHSKEAMGKTRKSKAIPLSGSELLLFLNLFPKWSSCSVDHINSLPDKLFPDDISPSPILIVSGGLAFINQLIYPRRQKTFLKF